MPNSPMSPGMDAPLVLDLIWMSAEVLYVGVDLKMYRTPKARQTARLRANQYHLDRQRRTSWLICTVSSCCRVLLSVLMLFSIVLNRFDVIVFLHKVHGRIISPTRSSWR